MIRETRIIGMPSGTYANIVKEIENYLRDSNSLNASSSRDNKQIVREIRKRIRDRTLKVDVGDGTILSYLSYAANQDQDSKIVSGGPHGGYWLVHSIEGRDEEKISDETKVSSNTGQSITVKEKDLYPLIELWLESKGYSAKDTSTLKSGGKWGNPDILGASRWELFGSVEVDIGSCEIKLAKENWEQVIFEAISHKRFSNRSWFCYRTSAENEPLPKNMDYYAERYRVGVVQIVLSDSDLLSLKSGKKAPLDLIERVIEKVPALYDRVPVREQREVIDRTGISLTLTF